MFKINLSGEGRLNERQVECHFDASEFAIEFSSEQVQELRELNPYELQDRLNEIFSQERREAMIAKSSRDPKGRPVRYYRAMGKKRFFAMLERGEDLSKPEEIDHDELRYLISHVLERYADFLQSHRELGDELEEKISDLVTARDISSLISWLFPSMPATDRKILIEASSLEDVRLVLTRYLPNKLKQSIHGGSADFIVTDYISMSAGGIIQKMGFFDTAYLEIVMDDSEVIVPGRALEGEKEVLTKSIKMGNIARVVVLGGQCEQEFVEAEDSNIRLAIDESGKRREIDDPIEAWRWGTKRNDYLPVSLQAKAQRSEVHGYSSYYLED
ncbi:hypothetical protein L6260_02370 [Candidatus Parcubacteria bacterium]|nr:hypothetical protein [Candidatus Parcubacteria bacterium]